MPTRILKTNNAITKAKRSKSNALTLITGVPAGFPSPANEFSQHTIDLNEIVVEHAAATYYVRVQGHSMRDAGIYSGDLLVVDRSLDYKENSIVVAVVDGEFTVKRVRNKNGVTYLVAENNEYKPIALREGMCVEIWGVVTYVLHQLVR